MAGLLSDDEEGITKKPPGAASKVASEKSPAPVRDQGREDERVVHSGQMQLAQPETPPGRYYKSQIPDQEIPSVSEQGVGRGSPVLWADQTRVLPAATARGPGLGETPPPTPPLQTPQLRAW